MDRAWLAFTADGAQRGGNTCVHIPSSGYFAAGDDLNAGLTL